MGNVGRDPEVSQTKSGDTVANISIATSSRWIDKATGDRREETEWHHVILFRKSAEIAEKYLKKGHACLVEGRLKTRKWADKNNVDHYTTEIITDRLVLLEKRVNGERAEQSPAAEPVVETETGAEVPF
jgi:single-strand DNA-binding protein